MKLHKDAIYLGVIILLIALCGQFYYSYHYQPVAERSVSVYYNQEIETNRKVIDVIDRANRYVHFAIYTFTRTDIKDALLGAKLRGLEVRGVVDKEQTAKIADQRKIIEELTAAGIPIVFQDHDAIMHMKALVTEQEFLSGSYNWTKSATDSNDEIIEIGRDESLRKQYDSILNKLFQKYSQTMQ